MPTGSNLLETISCTFSTVSLDKCPSYEALSYVWGTTKDRTVVLNNTAVTITRNLYDALYELRSEIEERVLWVDALCINQADTDERTQQVSQMKHIYERAACVLVFLGQAWPGCNEAMDFFEITGSDDKIHYSPGLSPHVVVQGMDTSSDKLREHIIQFFDLAWWKRVWTVQECVLAQNLVFQCGTRILSGNLLLRSFENVNAHDNDCCTEETCFMEDSPTLGLCVWDGFTRMDMLAYMRTKRHACSFLQTLSSFRTRQSTDPRDKIYGMLGLAAEDLAGCIKPDYTKTTEEVYQALVFAVVEKTKKLDIFSGCYGDRKTGLQLPSFVPDWSAAVEELTHAGALSRAFAIPHFDASGGAKAKLKPTSAEKVSSKGAIFDAIALLGSSRGDDSTSPETMQEWRRLAQVDGIHIPPTTPLPIDDQNVQGVGANTRASESAFWQTMCGGMACDWDNGNHFWRRAEHDKDWPRYEKWLTWVNSSHESQDFDPEVGHFDNAHSAAVSGRCFAVTTKGSIGFVPTTANVGDIVAVLAGGDVPYILRLSQGQGADDAVYDCYKVVGDAYIHGIMDGEAITKGGWADGEIHLT
ncbi:HET-domain-containing protein [Paramyrothecium foliicola]|nr:HET-domain-containing protein [Paramyrothecium foliicola]